MKSLTVVYQGLNQAKLETTYLSVYIISLIAVFTT